MRKTIALGITLLIIFSLLAGCDDTSNSNNPVADSESTQLNIQSPNYSSGVEMTVNSIMPQKGIYITLDNLTDNEYTYSEDYALYVYENDSWKAVQPIIDNWGFNSIGYILAPQSKTDEIFIDWSWLYGELSGGDYLIEKGLLLVRKPGDYDEYILEAEFSIPGNINNGPARPDNSSLLSSWKPLTDLPSDYSKEQAVADGVYVNIHGAEMYNQALVDTFYMDALNGIAAFMRTIEYTVEGDPIITDFQYDGTIFTVTTDISRDKFKGIESEDIFTVTYKYLVPLNRAVPASVPATSSDAPAIYYLSNDENIFITTTDGRGVTLIDGLGRIPSPSNP
jgi:hypothetical protein